MLLLLFKLHLKIYCKIQHYEYLFLFFFFKSFIYVFNPLYVCELRVQCRTLHMDIPLYQYYFLKRLFFPPLIILAMVTVEQWTIESFSKSIDHKFMDLFLDSQFSLYILKNEPFNFVIFSKTVLLQA